MAEPHVINALRDKRSELAGMVNQLERQLAQHRGSLTHVDATMRLFDPDSRPQEIHARQQRARSAWFRPGECLRLIYDELRDAVRPLTTRELAEQIMRVKAMAAADERQRDLVQKTILGSLNRAKETIERIEAAGVVSWRIRQAACARCQ
jgi:DNA repair exonuclease SbcCD ATPase subunit